MMMNHTRTPIQTPKTAAYRARFGVRIVAHARGPRTYLFGLRIHHGSAGALLTAAGLALARRHRAGYVLAAIGAVALYDDRADFPFRDCDNHYKRG